MCIQLVAFNEKPQEIILFITDYVGTNRDTEERFIYVLIKWIRGVFNRVNRDLYCLYLVTRYGLSVFEMSSFNVKPALSMRLPTIQTLTSLVIIYRCLALSDWLNEVIPVSFDLASVFNVCSRVMST